MKRGGLSRLLVALLVAVTLAGAMGRAQIIYGPMLPSDPDMDDIASKLAISAGMVGLAAYTAAGPIASFHMQAGREFDQAMLWIYRLQADDAMMTAFMTESFLQLDRQIHGAVAAADYLVNKLKQDAAWFEERNGSFTNPGYNPPTRADRLDFARYKEIKCRVRVLETAAGADPGCKPAISMPQGGPTLNGGVGLPQAGRAVLAAFDDVRRRVIGRGMFVRQQTVKDSKAIGNALIEFGKTVQLAELVATRFMRIDTDDQVVPSPMQQVRLDIENVTTDLVFFVRMWDRAEGGTVSDCGGNSYKLRQDVDQWIVVWPKKSQAQLTLSDAAPVDLQLPDRVWLPAKLRDRLEIRVATYGDTRKRIRWQHIIGREVRPELGSLTRGFYWLGYQVNQGEPGQLVSRWFPVEEKYQWQFPRGLWADGMGRQVISTPAEQKKELREKLLERLNLVNDRVTFCLPTSTQSVQSDPNMSALVSGDSQFLFTTQKDPLGQPRTEKGSGELSVSMKVW